MLIIRKEQIQTFEERKILDYENEMVQHIKSFTPKQYKLYGNSTVKEIVKSGVKRAEKYEFTKQGSVRFYIEMMFMFGSDFDSDPQYPWIIKQLLEGTEANQLERADKIHANLLDYIRKVVGPAADYEKNALQRISKLHLKDYQKSNSEDPDKILEFIKPIYPEKCDYLGIDILSKLHWLSVTYAKRNGILENGGISIIFILMFSFGCGCCNDLQYPWVSNSLKKSSKLISREKIEKLFSKMMIYFNRVISS